MKHVRGLPRSSFFWSTAAILGNFVRMYVRMYVERTRPLAMPLPTMTMKTQTHGFTNFPCSHETYGKPMETYGAPL